MASGELYAADYAGLPLKLKTPSGKGRRVQGVANESVNRIRVARQCKPMMAGCQVAVGGYPRSASTIAGTCVLMRFKAAIASSRVGLPSGGGHECDM